MINTDNYVLYNDDCMKVLPQIKNAKAVITDPPYMINSKSDGFGKLSPWADICNSAYWYAAWLDMARSTLNNDGCLWTCLNWRSIPTFTKALCDARWSFASMMIWDKGWIGPSCKNQLRPRYEMVGLCTMPQFEISDRTQPDIRPEKWSAYKPTGHPAEKPVNLIRHLIEISTKPDDLIVDPFMGSGTTGVAAMQTGRRFIGIEQDEKWYQYAVTRIEMEMNGGVAS